MDARVQKVLLNAAVYLYAVFGFSLSVLTSLLSLLGARQPPKPVNIPLSKQPLPRNRPVARTLRCCSDKPSTAASAAKSAEPALEEKQRRRKMLAAHRRSRSIPLITLDYFGSTENLHKTPHGNSDVELSSRFGSLPVRKPLTFVLPPPPGRERVEPPWTADYDTEKSGFRIANLFSKEKKREKENVRKVGERTPSPPPASSHQFKESTLLPQAPRKRQKSDVSKRPLVPKDGQANLMRAPMRRVSSAPTEERLTMKFDLTFSRTIEKKKSSTLRTQPYDAPFFCPPPVQPTRPKPRDTVDSTPRKAPRSSTMKI